MGKGKKYPRFSSTIHVSHVITVCTPSFVFPSDAYLVRTVRSNRRFATDEAEVLLHKLFLLIALNFSIDGADTILSAQAQMIFRRIPLSFSREWAELPSHVAYWRERDVGMKVM